MNVVVSGQAGVALVMDDDRAFLIDADAPDEDILSCPEDFRYVFAGVGDLLFLSDVASRETAVRELVEARDRTEALHLALVLFDDQLPAETRRFAAECLDELLDSEPILHYVENVLYAHELPEEADEQGAFAACESGTEKVRALVERLRRHQPYIRHVRLAWEVALESVVGAGESRVDCQNAALNQGLFRALSRTVAAGDSVDGFQLSALTNPAVCTLPRHRELIMHWTRAFQCATVAHEECDRPAAEGPEKEVRDRRPKARNRRRKQDLPSVLAEVERLKAAAVQAMESGDEAAARERADDVLGYIVEHGEHAHVSNALHDLATSARLLDLPDLHADLARQSVDYDSRNAAAWTELGYAHLAEQDLDGALADFERAEQLGDPFAISGRATALRRLGRPEEALQAYDTLVHAQSENVILRNERAETLRELGRLEEALQAYDATVQTHPTNAVARNGRAETLRELGRLEEALQAYDATIRMHRRNAVARNGRAETLRELGRLEEALQAYDATIRAHPRDAFARSGRAETLRELGRLAQALEAYNQTTEADPRNAVAQNGRAETLRALGRPEEALAAYDATIRAHPRNAVAQHGRAETLRELDRLEEALAAYDETIRAHPRDPVARNGRATVLMSGGRFEEVLAELRVESPRTLNEWIAYHIRGMALLRLRRLEEAERIFEEGVARNPRPTSAAYFRSALAVVRLKQGQLEAARQLLEATTSTALEGPVSVLRVHVYGELDERELASEAYRNLGRFPRLANDEVAHELNRRYIAREQPLHDANWLFDRECELLLAA